MRKTILALIVVIISVIGIIDAGYITYQKAIGSLPPCSPQFKCSEVLNSPYAYFGPLPLAAYGVFFYAAFLVLGSWYLLNLETGQSQQAGKIRSVMLIWGSFGLGFSVYLLFLMGVVLQAWCFYCLLSAINCVLLFCTSAAIYLSSRKS